MSINDIEFDFDLDINEEDEEEILEAVEKLSEWAEAVKEQRREWTETLSRYPPHEGTYFRTASESDDVDIEEALEEADIDADEIAAELEAEDDEEDSTTTYGSGNGFTITVEDDGATTGPCEGTTSNVYGGGESTISHQFNTSSEDDSDDDESASEDAEEPPFVYECPRSWTNDDGDTEHCDGVHESTKDYGEHVFRRCPECDEEVAMIRDK